MGYQTKLVAKSAYSLSAGTFINTTGSDIKLKEITFATDNGTGTFRRNNFFIQFFNDGGSPATIAQDSVMSNFCLTASETWPTGDLKFWSDNKKHWYLDSDTGKTIEMDNYPIAAGRGFNIFVGSLGDVGVNVTFAGAVDDQDTFLTPANSSYFLAGNSRPTELKLEDLVLGATANLRRNNFFIQFFNDGGSPATIAQDSVMSNFCLTASETWPTGDLKFWSDNKKHWYLDSDSGKTIEMDKYPIAAGRGFNIFVGSVSGGVTVTIPSALQDEKAAE